MANNAFDKFVRVEVEDLPGHLFRESAVLLRSLEKLLEKHKYPNVFDGRGCSVCVEDRSAAQRLGLLLNLSEVKFIDGGILNKLILKKESNRGRPRNTIIDTSTGKGYTFNQFKKINEKDVKKTCLTKSRIVSLKLMTRGTLEKAIIDRKLEQIRVGNKIFISRSDIAKFLGVNMK